MNVFESAADLIENVENLVFWNLFAFIFIDEVLQVSMAEFHHNSWNIIEFD
jgi:hypothetical protein